MKERSTIPKPGNERTACVIFEEPRAARRAWKDLRRSGIPRPVRISFHQGEISQDGFTIDQSRSRVGALLGALVVGLPTGIFLGFAASSQVLETLTTSTAIAVGLLGGSALGALTGMLVGATEPPAVLARARAAVRRGKVALVARFRSKEQASRARELLQSHPSAVRAIG